LTPSDHPAHPDILDALARALQSRYERTGTRNDRDSAIRLKREVNALLPKDDGTRPMILGSLSYSLLRNFEPPLLQAIAAHEESVTLTVNHSSHREYLNNLGGALK